MDAESIEQVFTSSDQYNKAYNNIYVVCNLTILGNLEKNEF